MNRDFGIMIRNQTFPGETIGNSNNNNRMKPKSVEMRKDLRNYF